MADTPDSRTGTSTETGAGATHSEQTQSKHAVRETDGARTGNRDIARMAAGRTDTDEPGGTRVGGLGGGFSGGLSGGTAEPDAVLSSQPLGIGDDDDPGAAGRPAAGGGSTRLGDRVFTGLTSAAAGFVILLVVLVAVFLIVQAAPSIFDDKDNFLTSTRFDTTPGALHFGVAALLYTTVLIAIVALILAVPLAIGIALFITQYAPRRLAKPVANVIDLLAAIPSIIYGIWGIRVFAPHLTGLQTALGHVGLGLFSPQGIATGTVLVGGIVLAIMVLPIITAISRDVFERTPNANKEAALALGATRWEMIRMAVLPYGRPGVVSGSMLGLGRALGETVMVYIILSSVSKFNLSLLNGGQTIASKIALGQAEFGRHPGPYIAAGLVLFLLTFVVNAAARGIVARRSVESRGAREPGAISKVVTRERRTLAFTGLGVVLLALSYLALTWFSATGLSYTFRKTHDAVSAAGGRADTVASLYFSWLGYLLFAAAVLVAVLSVVPSVPAAIRRASGYSVAILGVALTYWAMRLGIGVDAIDNVSVAFWFAILGFLLVGLTVARSAKSTTTAKIRLIGRKPTNVIATGLVSVSVLIALAPLVWLLFTVVSKGYHVIIKGSWWTESQRNITYQDAGGGELHAIVGTLEQVALCSVIAVPIGLLVGVYLVEYGRGGLFARATTFMVDILTGIPSIVAALFIFAVVVTTLGGQTAAWLVSLALVMLMLPVVVRSTEEMLKLVPNELREASLALGVPKWKTITSVVIPTAFTGLITGVILGIARVAGETAPLLILVGYAPSMNFNLFNGPQGTLPGEILSEYGNLTTTVSSSTSYHLNALGQRVAGSTANYAGDRMWGAALTLILIVLVLNLVARLIGRLNKVAK